MLLNSLPIMENKFVCGFPYRQRQPYLAVHRYKDTGNGIVPEDIERIFERFYQSKRASNIPFMDKAAQESDYSYVRKSFLCTEATSMQETIPSKELSSEYYYLWKKVSPKPNQKKKNMSRMNIHFPFLPMETRKRKPSSLLKIMQICVLIFVPFSKTIIN